MKIWFVLGYLGSGKTSFVKNFLSRRRDKKIAVVINDFGAIDVDAKILSKYSDISPIYGGSIFCSCKSDKFVDKIIELSKGEYDEILVETSGLANPYTLINLLDLIRSKDITLSLMPVFCLVDSTCFEKVLPSVHMLKMQVSASDVVLINKSDLVRESDLKRIESIISEINSSATILITSNSVVPSFDFPLIEKKLPQNVLDISVQKCLVKLLDISQEQLNTLSKELSKFCHRIKGVVKISGENYIYEYITGIGKAEKTEAEAGGLVLLSVGGKSLKEAARKIIGNKGEVL